MEKYGLLFETIFRKKLTDADTVSYLENVVKEHPYFSIAQFYLLSLSEKNVNGYKTQAKKTSVLFNNNYWLNFQLQEVENNEQQAVEEIVAPAQSVSNIYTEEEKAETVAEIVVQEEPLVQVETSPQIIEKEPVTVEEQQTEIENTIEETNSIGEAIAEVYTPPVAEDIPVIDEETKQPEVETVAEEKEEPVETTDAIQEAAIDTTTDEDNIEVKEAIQEIITEPVIENNETAEENMDEVVVKNDTPLTQAPVTATVNESLLFEPLHTTDYFASVGIKLSEEEKSSDRLGKQLMSFTQWLKTMKKVHAEQLVKTSTPTEVSAATTESGIQKLAEKSNQEDDVITEAMADVLEQQGKHDKAVEILEKLSLLNPGKSTYFAAKINQIKEK